MKDVRDELVILDGFARRGEFIGEATHEGEAAAPARVQGVGRTVETRRMRWTARGERGGVKIFSRRVWVSVDGPGEEWGVKERGMGRPAGPGGFSPVGPRPRGVSFFCFFCFAFSFCIFIIFFSVSFNN